MFVADMRVIGNKEGDYSSSEEEEMWRHTGVEEEPEEEL